MDDRVTVGCDDAVVDPGMNNVPWQACEGGRVASMTLILSGGNIMRWRRGLGRILDHYVRELAAGGNGVLVLSHCWSSISHA